MANLNMLLIILLCNWRGAFSMDPHYHQGSNLWRDGNDVHDYSQPYSDSGYPQNYANDYQNYDFQVPVGPSSSTHQQHYYEGTSQDENGPVPRYDQSVLEGEIQNNNPHHDVTDTAEPLIHQYEVIDNEEGLPCINGCVVPLEVPAELYVVYGFIGSTTSPHVDNAHQKQEQVMETIKRVMLASLFKDSYNIHLLKIQSWSTAGRDGADEKQRFLIRLCLMSARFFMSIHQPNDEKLIDDTLEQELDRMLDWLYGILNGTSDLSSPQNWVAGAVRQTVAEQTSQKQTDEPFISVTRKIKSITFPVNCFEAMETRSILFVLGNYCRSTNPVKWRKLFEKDVFFFKLLVNITFNISDGHLNRNLNYQDRTFELLPWKDPWNGVLHKEYMPFKFHLLISAKIKSRIEENNINPYKQKSWEDLISWEKKGEIWSKYHVTYSRSSDDSNWPTNLWSSAM